MVKVTVLSLMQTMSKLLFEDLQVLQRLALQASRLAADRVY